MATKIYIAGKITGDPDYKAKFNAAAEAYKKKMVTPCLTPPGCRRVCKKQTICVFALQ